MMGTPLPFPELSKLLLNIPGGQSRNRRAFDFLISLALRSVTGRTDLSIGSLRRISCPGDIRLRSGNGSLFPKRFDVDFGGFLSGL